MPFSFVKAIKQRCSCFQYTEFLLGLLVTPGKCLPPRQLRGQFGIQAPRVSQRLKYSFKIVSSVGFRCTPFLTLVLSSPSVLDGSGIRYGVFGGWLVEKLHPINVLRPINLFPLISSLQQLFVPQNSMQDYCQSLGNNLS